MNELLLACALSMPLTHFNHTPILMEGKVHNEYAELLAFIRHVYPDAEIHIQRDESETQRLKMWGWWRSPFRWRHYPVWIKRSA